jgi:hypothetical protein
MLRKTFGFVQFLDERSARSAIEQEQGSMIGGLRIDLSLADNRPVRSRDAEDGRSDRAERKRDRSRRGRGSDRRERSGSRGREEPFPPTRRRGSDGLRIDDERPVRRLGPPEDVEPFNRRSHPETEPPARRPPIKPPDALSDVLIVRVDRPGRGYCLSIEEQITNLGLLYEDRDTDLQDLPETVRVAAERSTVRHVLVVGGRHEPLDTVTIGSRTQGGRIEGWIVLSYSLYSFIPLCW